MLSRVQASSSNPPLKWFFLYTCLLNSISRGKHLIEPLWALWAKSWDLQRNVVQLFSTAPLNNLADGPKLPRAIYIHFVSLKWATTPPGTVFRAWSSRWLKLWLDLWWIGAEMILRRDESARSGRKAGAAIWIHQIAKARAGVIMTIVIIVPLNQLHHDTSLPMLPSAPQ